jgi:hypothetical protein
MRCLGRLENSLLSTAKALTPVGVYWLLLLSTRLQREEHYDWKCML